MLVRLVYASRAKATLTPAQFEDILAVSRRNNPANGITGVLCTNTFIFLQMLEGGRKEVSETYNRIARDPRHHDVQLLHFEEIMARKFADWSMGKVSFDRLNMAVLLKHSAKAVLDPYAVSGAVSVALIEELMQTAAVS
ncbi:BLUF domain-containing protein [Casimicrobium huifangae]|uniref:BLUF domain-containing protein n=1 Tax=Casimicrobium huifangae TaxID=2591109 RepID=UPI0012EB1CEA|nr:BLUF domain-containing protein [Casimicrobium huifangae]